MGRPPNLHQFDSPIMLVSLSESLHSGLPESSMNEARRDTLLKLDSYKALSHLLNKPSVGPIINNLIVTSKRRAYSDRARFP
jgi:hypothetical protein